MKTILVLVLLFALPACAFFTDPLYSGDELDWEQYQAIRPGMTSREIREVYGVPHDERVEDGLIWRFSYLCWDEAGTSLHTVDLEFDQQEVLVKRSFW